MSFLYPLFLAGIAAIGLPILAHMIRSRTRKRVTFSSLMFVPITLPRFRNRSRIEHLLLLILRCAVLCLLALAFSRPFFPRAVGENHIRPGRRITLLIDTSASMRRAGLWAQAVSEAQSVLEAAEPTDHLCVMSFDRDTHTLIGFEQWQELEPAQRVAVTAEQIARLSPGWDATNLGQALVAAAEAIEDDEVNDAQQPLAIRRVVLISDLQQGSHLEALHAYQWPKGTELAVKPVRCQGTTNAAIQWVPDRDPVAPGGGPRDDGCLSVRISNSSDAVAERFQLSWAESRPAGTGTPSQALNVYVPAGHSIVVRVPTPKDGLAGGKLVLTGDDHSFDNTVYLAPHLQQQVNILYIGTDDADDPNGMLYYAQRAFGATRAFNPRIISHRAGEGLAEGSRRAGFHTDIATAHLIIMAADGSEHPLLLSASAGTSLPLRRQGQESTEGLLRRYLESGGTVLLVMKSPDAATTVAGLTGIEAIESEEADVNPPDADLIRSRVSPWYAMLGQIDFQHPLMAPFSEPRFGDFTRIHFWKYRRINPADFPQAQVLAWFDNPRPHGDSGLAATAKPEASSDPAGDPAWLQIPVGKGTLLLWTCGWHPSDSDIALSSKFVPLLYSILEYGGVLSEQPLQYFVGDYVSVPHSVRLESADFKVRKPDDSLISLDAGQQSYTRTDLPGIYTVESSQPREMPKDSRRTRTTGSDGDARSPGEPGVASDTGDAIGAGRLFAVNLSAKESRTAPMAIEDLERLGVLLENSSGALAEPRSIGQRTPHRSNLAEMEKEQKIWRWVLVAAMAVLLIEIWLGGWLTRPDQLPQGEQK